MPARSPRASEWAASGGRRGAWERAWERAGAGAAAAGRAAERDGGVFPARAWWAANDLAPLLRRTGVAVNRSCGVGKSGFLAPPTHPRLHQSDPEATRRELAK